MPLRMLWRGTWAGANPTYAEAALDQDEPYEGVVTERVYALLDPASCEIKIGHTRSGNVEARKRAHERARGRKLELLGTINAGGATEHALHGKFADHATSRGKRNEWFSSEIAAELIPLLDNVA